jgi:quercetin dioxygenase-like cupin family protein
MATQIAYGAPYALAAGEGTQMTWFSSSMTLKASAPDFGAVELSMVPGDEPPLHIHRREDEWFYLLEGEVTFHVGGEDLPGSSGSFVHFPRDIAHTFTVETPSARFLVFNTPGGFERMFERNPQSIDEAVAALTDFGMEVVGPHPRELAPTG